VFLQKYDVLGFSKIFRIILLKRIPWNWFMGLYTEFTAPVHESMVGGSRAEISPVEGVWWLLITYVHLGSGGPRGSGQRR
jgi:hypothetical protein